MIHLNDKCKLFLKIDISYKDHLFSYTSYALLLSYNNLNCSLSKHNCRGGFKCVTAIIPKFQVLFIDSVKNISGKVLTNIPELQTLSCAKCDNIHMLHFLTTSEKLKNEDAALEAYTKHRKNTVPTMFVHGTSITKLTTSLFKK